MTIKHSQSSHDVTFVDKVRRREVPQPTQKTFSIDRWRDAFSGVPSQSVQDRRLYEAGLWAFQKFETIRQRLEKISLLGISRSETIRMYIGEANRGLQILEAKSRSVDGLIVAEQIVQAKVKRAVDFGGSSNPEDLLMASVDALRFSIQKAYQEEERHEGLVVRDDLEALERLKLVTVLAQLYNICDGYWMQALWNDWHVESKDDLDLVRFPEGVRPIISAISDYRRSALMIETAFHFEQEWRHKITERGRKVLLTILPRIVENTEPSEWTIVGREELDGGARTLFLNRFLAERGYYARLIHEPIAGIAPITPHMLLTAWEVLYAIAEALISKFPDIVDSGVFSIDKLMKYAPTMRKVDMIRLIQRWCNLPIDLAENLFEFFCFKKGTKWELWGHPLVELDAETVAPLLAPVFHGNMERTFELWMKNGKLDLTGKGADFEDYARTELAQALSDSDKLSDAEIVQHSVVVTIGDVEEEIDLVIRIGNVILIGEAKCILFPSDPIEVSRYFEVLFDAVTQVRRKSDFAKRDIAQVLDRVSGGNKLVSDNVAIHPFVLINQPFGAGFPLDAVPIVDELIWKRFFEGKYYQMVSLTEEGEERAQSITDLYSDDADAARKVVGYLNDPPQLRHYQQNLKTGVEGFPRISETDRYFAAAYLEVMLPFPSFNF